MVVKMKELEAWCLKFAGRWNKPSSWDFFCLCKDAWLAGARDMRLRLVEELGKMKNATDRHDYQLAIDDIMDMIDNFGEFKIDLDIGSNQIGTDEIFKVVPIEKKLKADLETHFDCTDVRVDVTNGLVSFQGTFNV